MTIGSNGFLGAVRKPTPVAAPSTAEVAPEPPPAPPEPFCEGFAPFVGAPRPARVSAAAWDAVFPPDRERIRRLAGRHFIAGVAPDAAVRAAVGDLEAERWAEGVPAARLAALAPAFGASADVRPPTPQLAAACDAVHWTALGAWRRILADPDPVRASFRLRAWGAPANTCLVCGKPVGDDARRFKREGCEGPGDAIHPGCMAAMAAIGPVFGRLVVEEAHRFREAEPPPAEDDDPDGEAADADGDRCDIEAPP